MVFRAFQDGSERGLDSDQRLDAVLLDADDGLLGQFVTVRQSPHLIANREFDDPPALSIAQVNHGTGREAFACSSSR